MALRESLKNGAVIRLFALARLFHPVVIDMTALSRWYGGFWIDQEHGGATVHDVTACAVAARANNLECLVRLAPVGYWQVTQCLEAGAGGVMAAQIGSVEQAREFAGWARFPPLGTRGLNTSGRDADYTHQSAAEFVASAHRATVVGIQIETRGALEDVDDIAALEGVDYLFVGPSDLSLALGVVGQFHHPDLWAAIDRVAAACRRHGKAWGAVLPDPAFAARALAGGCQLPSIGSDVQLLRRGLESFGRDFAGESN